VNRNILYGGIAVVLVIAGIIYLQNAPGEYDEFAQCLTDKGAMMYGAYWCGHCNDQKEMFGNSWKHIDYVECSLPNNGGQTKECSDAGIRGYPTWEFSDGSRESGKLSFELLSLKTGCSLDAS
jgi:hypothetical protein